MAHDRSEALCRRSDLRRVAAHAELRPALARRPARAGAKNVGVARARRRAPRLVAVRALRGRGGGLAWARTGRRDDRSDITVSEPASRAGVALELCAERGDVDLEVLQDRT